VDILAYFELERWDVWFLFETGIRGLLVPDERGFAVYSMAYQPASQYSSVNDRLESLAAVDRPADASGQQSVMANSRP
jgi:hypothetical protein